ncbi:MAG: 5-methyltetrahydropteroyltriglutamate--homocysteine S-methyltransferase [Gammaproteobacteria bacterium]|nr:5-methyltetrahydropteroyltriglutamate--homocysteine S-methyltransferase [Gammaproteobacteria bacterium]
MTKSHILGFPRIGTHRELKKALEAYWQGSLSQLELEAVAQQIRRQNWQIQSDAGLDLVTVGDFAYYDQVLDMSALLGVIPERFGHFEKNVDLNTIFCMARGQAPLVKDAHACEMTKWFNTNYHYIVPELTQNQTFHLATTALFQQIDEAQALGHKVKPVLLGPLSYLWLSKTKNSEFNKLDLLEKLLLIYNQIFTELKNRKIEWVQMDEPILVLDLPMEWQQAYRTAYQKLDFQSLRCLLTTYFGSIKDKLTLVNQLPIHGLHIDTCSDSTQLAEVIADYPSDRVLSVGVVSGRNIWRTDLQKTMDGLQQAKNKLGNKLWLASSCSLQHVPVDLDQEIKLDPELKSWLAFAKQKVTEITLLTQALTKGSGTIAQALSDNQQALQLRACSKRIHNDLVKKRLIEITPGDSKRHSSHDERAKKQRKLLHLPLFPTTTIGSFPQTKEIREIRQQYKTGKMNHSLYKQKMQEQIAFVIAKQEALDLDVLVHGEPERNDMVEYFGELLNGFAFTQNGWVQSYGSRCVKPPIIYGDVSRPQAMTVEWASYAQSLTTRHMKGMLTGPVTILSWSFVRDDQPLAQTSLQIALALRDEVVDLESAGIHVIQIDEPAFREALPLRRQDWQSYLDWAVRSFQISACGVQDQTQIHTHMCYSEFNDVIEAIAALDADVITIESSRSEMELLKAFDHFAYPNEIGPGVYDIHSPRIPTTDDMFKQLEKALKYIPPQNLWVNPDCGLKTRGWPEVERALHNMISAAKLLRKEYREKTICTKECAHENA